jgi:hypothetical protein
MKINALELGILSFIHINAWNNAEIKQKMRDHFLFMQEYIRAKATVKKFSC